MVDHKHIIAFSRRHPLFQRIIICIPLQAFIRYPDTRIFFHKLRYDLFYNKNVLRFILISKKGKRNALPVCLLIIHHLIAVPAARQNKNACQNRCAYICCSFIFHLSVPSLMFYGTEVTFSPQTLSMFALDYFITEVLFTQSIPKGTSMPKGTAKRTAILKKSLIPERYQTPKRETYPDREGCRWFPPCFSF